MLKLCIIIIFISCIQVFGQRQLVLIKGNTVITRFSEGDRIRFKRNDTDYIFNGIITGISQEYFKLGDEDTTYLHQIKSIDLRGLPNSGFKTADMGGKFIAAGAVLLLIDALNTANGNKISTGVVLVSSSFIVVGSAMLIFNNNYFKPGRKKRVIIMG